METAEPSPIKFSIITVTKNAAPHIAACLESVAKQNYASLEHIIIDSASTDGTQDIVTRRGAPRVRMISEADQGIYDGMNKGLRMASGDYMLFLGADDVLVDAKVLSDIAGFLRDENLPDMIYGDIETRDTSGRRGVYRAPAPGEALDVMICGCLPHQATVAHRDVFFDKVGLFDTRYRVQADYDWFLRVLGTEGLRIRHMDRIVASFMMGGTSSQLQQGQEETYAIQNAFPLYREPEWVERRLYEFQRQLLAYRLQLQTVTECSWGYRIVRKVLRGLARK